MGIDDKTNETFSACVLAIQSEWYVAFSGAYFGLNMVIITLSTFLSVVVINLYFRGDKRTRVPLCMRRVRSCLPSVRSVYKSRQSVRKKTDLKIGPGMHTAYVSRGMVLQGRTHSNM